jgi:uncharacterized protein
MTASLDLAALRPRAGTQAFFRYRPVGDRVVVTNFEGNFLLLTRDEFAAYAAGTVPADSELHRRLSQANFLRADYDVRRAAERLQARRGFLHAGPNLHIFVVTLRCNETCVYCHASRANMDAVHTDMTTEIAEKAVDLALRSTSPFITIEFQGGEPLVNFPVVRHVCEYASDRARQLGKALQFTMVSNFSLMDDEKLEFLIAHRVQLCTSIDGPEALHNAQRKLPTMDAHQRAATWIRKINRRYEAMGLDPTLYHVEALLTTTKDTLPLWKEVVDTYVGLGCKALFLRPIDPFGFADRTRLRVDYPRSAYLEFYRNAVDYMLALNKQGVQVLERYAAIFLTKILRGVDPNFLDLRSPSGAGIGQLAYNYDGKVFTCDEGRMLHEMGDDRFLLGDVHTGYRAHRRPRHRALDGPRVQPRRPARLRQLRLPALLRHDPDLQLQEPGQHLRPDADQRRVLGPQGHPGLPVRAPRRGRPGHPRRLRSLDHHPRARALRAASPRMTTPPSYERILAALDHR